MIDRAQEQTTRRRALSAAIDTLRAAGAPDPARDARLLLRWAEGISAADLAAAPDALIDGAAAARFREAVARRAERRPVAQIIGQRAFYGRDFEVTPDVLDPRPESEALVEAALDRLPGDRAARVLDLGVGSGCLIVSVLAERSRATGVGVDQSAAALAVAARNARALGVGDRLDLRQGDWLLGIEERFDLILCNPPYIPEAEMAALEPEVRLFEPAAALTPGGDGLAVYRALAPALRGQLAPGGSALFEVGDGQAADVAALLRAQGLGTAVIADLGGKQRVVTATDP